MDKVNRIALRLVAGLALAATPLAAQAEVVGASYWSSSKSEAILGSSSALAAIMARQSGQVPSAQTGAGLLRSASISNVGTIASADRPDVFNSVALPVRQSSLDRRWAKVARAGVPGAANSYAASLRGRDPAERIDAVNSYVNARIRFVDDSAQFGAGDRWLAPSESLARGRGDCEDYAIAKRAMLRTAGFADKDLYLVVLKDLGRRADHAVLVVRVDGRFLVLDNGSDRIVDSSALRDYRPILTLTANRIYTHGYRRDLQPPVGYASLSTPAMPPRVSIEPAFGTSELPEVVRESVSLVPATLSF